MPAWPLGLAQMMADPGWQATGTERAADVDVVAGAKVRGTERREAIGARAAENQDIGAGGGNATDSVYSGAMTSRLTALRLLVAVVLCQTCVAQDAWERVKLIEPGKNVQVRLQSGKTVKGRMESWESTGLGLRQGKNTIQVAKSDVARVAIVGGMSRKRKALYAGLVAGGAGAALIGGACAREACYAPTPAVALGTGIMFGGIAAGIASLFPQHKEVIYTAR